MQRYPDWQAQFSQFLTRRSSQPFAYGEMDCCLFVADCVEAMTGTDLAVRFRGKYRSRKEALQLAKRETGRGSIRALIEKTIKEFGLREVPLPYTQRGDIVLVAQKDAYLLGILALNGKEILAASKTGFLRLPLSRAVCAWRI